MLSLPSSWQSTSLGLGPHVNCGLLGGPGDCLTAAREWILGIQESQVKVIDCCLEFCQWYADRDTQIGIHFWGSVLVNLGLVIFEVFQSLEFTRAVRTVKSSAQMYRLYMSFQVTLLGKLLMTNAA